MDIRCGVDIVDIDRIKKLLDKHEESFVTRTFTKKEIEYCKSKGNELRVAESFAANYAAKEAASKALGTGIMTKGIGFLDFEVIHEDNGCPGLILMGKALEEAQRLGMISLSLSMSHDAGKAVAFCTMLIEQEKD